MPDSPGPEQPDKNLADVDNAPEAPVKDWPKAPFTGAKWGALAGFLASQAYLQSNSVMGVYPGDAGLVMVPMTLAGAALGALAGWLTIDRPGG